MAANLKTTASWVHGSEGVSGSEGVRNRFAELFLDFACSLRVRRGSR